MTPRTVVSGPCLPNIALASSAATMATQTHTAVVLEAKLPLDSIGALEPIADTAQLAVEKSCLYAYHRWCRLRYCTGAPPCLAHYPLAECIRCTMILTVIGPDDQRLWLNIGAQSWQPTVMSAAKCLDCDHGPKIFVPVRNVPIAPRG